MYFNFSQYLYSSTLARVLGPKLDIQRPHSQSPTHKNRMRLVAFPRLTKAAVQQGARTINRLYAHTLPGREDPGTGPSTRGRHCEGRLGAAAAGPQLGQEVTKGCQGEGEGVCAQALSHAAAPAPGPHGTLPPPPTLMSSSFNTLHAHCSTPTFAAREVNASSSLIHRLSSPCRAKLRLKRIMSSFQRFWQHTLERLPGWLAGWSHSAL